MRLALGSSNGFLVRVAGNSLTEHGIYEGDLLVIKDDRALAFWGALIVCESGSTLAVEKLTGDLDAGYRGVVTRVVRSYPRSRLNVVESVA